MCLAEEGARAADGEGLRILAGRTEGDLVTLHLDRALHGVGVVVRLRKQAVALDVPERRLARPEARGVAVPHDELGVETAAVVEKQAVGLAAVRLQLDATCVLALFDAVDLEDLGHLSQHHR